MGILGDEDVGRISAFVVFSSLGFYPVIPSMAIYNIGTPVFENVKIHLSNRNVFEIIAKRVSDKNKYIQSKQCRVD